MAFRPLSGPILVHSQLGQLQQSGRRVVLRSLEPTTVHILPRRLFRHAFDKARALRTVGTRSDDTWRTALSCEQSYTMHAGRTSPRQWPPDTLAWRKAFLLREEIIFLNHGSFGACPRCVFDSHQRWQLELERQPVLFLGRKHAQLMQLARERLARFVGADTDEIVYTTNATTGLNVVARSIPLEPGDEILATDQEHGATDRAWRFVSQEQGTHYVQQGFSLPITSADRLVEEIWQGVTSRTKVLFLSRITSPTSVIFPLRPLIMRAREAGILTVVDGAHAPGQIPLNLHSLGPDYYVGNCHKWLCALTGSAFLYAQRERQALLKPLVVSWGCNAERPGSSRFVDEQEWQGTRDIAAFLAVPDAVAFQQEHDWPTVQLVCHELASAARQAIEDLTGLAQLCPDSSQWYAQMVPVPLPPCNAQGLQKRLYDEFCIEVPIVTWRDRQVIRISIQAYNDMDDVHALAQALKELLPGIGGFSV